MNCCTQRLLWGMAVLAMASALCGCGGGEQAPKTQIIIDSSPEQEAVVLVNGREYCCTPVEVKDIQPGWADVLVKKEDFRPAADRIQVRPGVSETFVIEMEPLVGFVSLESNPSGASVYLDGDNELGKTPLFQVELPVGEHTYQLRLDNYYPVEETLLVEQDYKYEFLHRMKPKEAQLSVLSRPTGATIYLNGRAQPKKTPAKFVLPPDTYLVGAYAKGFVQAEEKMVLAPNDRETITLKLEIGEVPQGMVLVPAGEFICGEKGRSPDESPRRKIFLDAFYIDKYEVTNEEFKKVFPDHSFAAGLERFPATGVSWNQAMEYARAVNKRLPTEVEWEKAARGEKGHEYPWGEEFDAELCNTAERDLGGPTPVGKFLGGISPFGCMDMAGNVYEWTRNWYQAYPGNKTITKDYGQIYRVLRGGSFMRPSFDARCARRHFDRMDAKRKDYGFRCAKDVEGSPN